LVFEKAIGAAENLGEIGDRVLGILDNLKLKTPNYRSP